MTSGDLTFFNALLSSAPEELLKQLENETYTISVLDTVVRFLMGAECTLPNTSQQTWAECHLRSRQAIEKLITPGKALKRTRDSDALEAGSPKRPRQSSEEANDTAALYVLNAVSTTSPVRKKVDIAIHKNSITFTNPTSKALESTVPLQSIKRAFVLPTRGKSKPHWTVVLLHADMPDRSTSGKTSVQQQIIFGLDATMNTFTTTEDSTSTIHPKGTETYALIYKFLSYLPSHVQTLEPDTSVFSSAASKDGAIAGIEAYRAAKPGTLWFFRQGILWGEGKPCEFWAAEDLIDKNEGVRVISATGRTCSVYLTRKGEQIPDENEEDLGDETEFAMVDGREQEPIHQWVKQHRHLFGKKDGAVAKEAVDSPKRPQVQAGKLTINQLILDGSDEEDEDFAASSEDSDDGSDSSKSSSSDEEEDNAGSEDVGDSGSEEEEEAAGEDDEMELDAAHHPLMQPGAMKKISGAAMQMVIDMVEGDLAGGDAEMETTGEVGGDSDEEDELNE